MDLLTPSSPGGVPTLSLTTNSSWLPWGRVAMPLISPLMPVPHATSEALENQNAKKGYIVTRTALSTQAKATDPTKLLLLNKCQVSIADYHSASK